MQNNGRRNPENLKAPPPGCFFHAQKETRVENIFPIWYNAENDGHVKEYNDG